MLATSFTKLNIKSKKDKKASETDHEKSANEKNSVYLKCRGERYKTISIFQASNFIPIRFSCEN